MAIDEGKGGKIHIGDLSLDVVSWRIDGVKKNMGEYEWLTTRNNVEMCRWLICNLRNYYLHIKPILLDAVRNCDWMAQGADIIREVVGNPFKNVLLPEYVNLPPSEWLEAGMPPATIPWLTPSVRGFAQSIIDSGDYDSVDVLADILEEAGCDNEEILRHLRGEVRCAECGGDEIARRDGPIFCTVCCNSCWLPKPVPCQPGCWVLRLLTEPQPPPDQSVTFRAGEIEG